MVRQRQVASGSVVSAKPLTRTFRDFWMRTRAKAVDRIDFEIERGEIFGLLGPNGSGKSTTIKMILGLLRPTSGLLTVFGRPPSDVMVKKYIGFLPEESYLYGYLTPLETLDYYGRLFGIARSERRRRSEELLEMVGLAGVGHRPVGEFSKGMMRRIGLAQALVNDPDLLILDEPTSGLDPIGTAWSCSTVAGFVPLVRLMSCSRIANAQCCECRAYPPSSLKRLTSCCMPKALPSSRWRPRGSV